MLDRNDRRGDIPGTLSIPVMRLSIRLLTAAALLALGGCRNPRVDANMAEALMQMGSQLSGIQQDYAILQSEVDSLRTVVARQDTIISRLAAQANLPAAAH